LTWGRLDTRRGGFSKKEVNTLNLTTIIRGFGLREAGSVSGDASTAILSGPTERQRTGIEIHNPDLGLDLWVRAVAEGAPAPTISATDRDFIVRPGATLLLAYGPEIALYLQNSSGGPTTSGYVAREVLS